MPSPVRVQIEGSRAVARAVALCRPQVIPAYPITPQTHIVEALGAMVDGGELSSCEFVTADSEFAAMSIAIGAAAAGVRAYTASASQGLLYMAEALFNAAGLGLPIVMTVANRAIGAPINIWNDHSDSMALRDCGWIQLYAEDNQAAVDLHVMAFRLAEQLCVPVMVCMDGFVLTHAVEPISIPEPRQIEEFLPPLRPRQSLDPNDPMSIGAMVGPDTFTEVRVRADRQLRQAVPALTGVADQYAAITGRHHSSVERSGPAGAPVILLALGSVLGTVREAVTDLPVDVAVAGLTQFRPFPRAAVREVLGAAEHVIVLERAFAPGSGGVVSADVRAALTGCSTRVTTVVAGLGGRPVTRAAVRRMVLDAIAGRVGELSFLDVREELL